MSTGSFRCPNCRRPLNSGKSIGGRVRFRCSNCHLEYSTTGPIRDEADAYIELLDSYETGRVDTALKAETKNAPISISDESLASKGLGRLPPTIRRVLGSSPDQLVKYSRMAPQEGDFGGDVEDSGLSNGLATALKNLGITRLHRYQQEVLDRVLAGDSVVIVAPTGGGKTEAFALPVFQSITTAAMRFGPIVASKRRVSALFVYPTKALNRDQLSKLRRLGSYEGITVDVFDGDTAKTARERIIRSPPDVLITDFDTIDYHLRLRDEFCSLLQSIRFLVVDELHQYVGTFGSHVHFIVARLKRLCSPFQVIAASATLPNALNFAEILFGREMRLIQTDRVSRGPIHFLMIYPKNRSFRTMMVDLAIACTHAGHKTLIFANTHIDAELIHLIMRRRGLHAGIHRAGLSPDDRISTETKFKTGAIQGLISTPTLELGIDIGDLDAVVSMLTDITRLTQRLGRAGRRGQESLAILALRDNDPISTFYLHNPDQYFRDLSPAYVEPKNEVVAAHQLTSAALDRPLRKGEFQDFEPVLSSLKKDGVLEEHHERLYPTREAWRFLGRRNLRNIGEPVSILYHGKKIGERQMPMAASELFPGAVYLHGGRRYTSRSFFTIPRGGRAEVEDTPEQYPYRTRPLSTTHPEILSGLAKEKYFSTDVHYCKLRVTEEIFGFLLMEIYTDKVAESRRLETPILYSYQTRGIVFRAPQPKVQLKESLAKADEDTDYEDALLDLLTGNGAFSGVESLGSLILGGSYHAFEHVMIEGSDMLVGGGRNEIGGVSIGDTGLVVIYDGAPGGSGISQLLFQRFDEAARRSLIILRKCSCGQTDGCPMCTYSYRCGNNNAPLLKLGAAESLTLMTHGEASKLDLEEFEETRPLR